MPRFNPVNTQIIIAVFVAVALSIGIFQHSRLIRLSGETAFLERQLPSPGSARRGRESPLAEPSIPASQDEIDFIREQLISGLTRSLDYWLTPENRRKMLLIAARFSAREMEALLLSLHSDPRHADLPAGKAIEAMLEIFSGTAPAATLEFLQAHREIAHWDGKFSGAFYSLLRTDPSQGIRWFEEQEALGNPDIQNPELRRSFLLRFAGIDPDKMLTRALSPAFASNPDSLSRLGNSLAATLNQPSERQQFLTALRRAAHSNSPSPQLDKIRSDFISGIARELAVASFDDAQMLVESEFSPDEKLAFAAHMRHSPDFIDPEKWAAWSLKIDPAAWGEWSQRTKARANHPAIRILSNWARRDDAAAAKWLEDIPAGDLKTSMTREFISTVAEFNPDKAISYLALIPEGESKVDSIRRINEVREFYSRGAR